MDLFTDKDPNSAKDALAAWADDYLADMLLPPGASDLVDFVKDVNDFLTSLLPPPIKALYDEINNLISQGAQE